MCLIDQYLDNDGDQLVCRLHGGPESNMVYAHMARLYDSAKQYRRAAHYYKLQIMSNAGSTFTHEEVAALICLANAYDWDAIVTGRACGWSKTA